MASKQGVSKSSDLIVCFGEMLIDFVPTVNGVSLAEAPAFKKAPGGAPANVAVGISRLGGGAAFMGKLGNDEFGRMLATTLRENGVKADSIVFDEHARTALAFVTLRKDGEREFVFYRNPSADMMLTEAELNVEAIKEARVFHYESISLIAEPCRSAHLAALKIAKEAGCLLSYDPNLREKLWPSLVAAREGILSIWETADVIKVSDEELKFICNTDDYNPDELVKGLFHDGLRLLLVTEGKDGCRYYTKDLPDENGDIVSGQIQSIAVNAVDSTGAGDAFVAALLTQIVRDETVLEDKERLEKALKFANIAGAITTTERGAIPALPTEEAINSHLPQPVRRSSSLYHLLGGCLFALLLWWLIDTNHSDS